MHSKYGATLDPSEEEKDPGFETDEKTGEVTAISLVGEMDGAKAGPLLYPCPRNEPRFKAHWDKLIADICQRPNMKESHLTQLEILCELYVELDDLNKLIKKHGMVFHSISRQGETLKIRPEVSQKNRVVAEIRNYSKALGLILHKDQAKRPEPDSDSWS